jgi:hypothetical protein
MGTWLESEGPYSGPYEAIRESSFYFVRRPAGLPLADPLFLLLDEETSVVTGLSAAVLAALPASRGVVIESVLAPSRLVSSAKAREALRSVWASALPLDLKKLVGNVAVGLVGRRDNTAERTLLFRREAEALHLLRVLEPLGAQLLMLSVGEERLYFVHIETRTPLGEGFYPIQHVVYDINRLRLYERALLVLIATDGEPDGGAQGIAEFRAALEAKPINCKVQILKVSDDDGKTVTGWPVGTFVRGRRVMWEGDLVTPSTGEAVRFQQAL